MTVSEPLPERPDPVATLTGSLSDRPFPKAICMPGYGGKFDTRGNVLPWPGNTFVCHIDRVSAAFTALVDMQDRVKKQRVWALLHLSSAQELSYDGLSGMVAVSEGGWLLARGPWQGRDQRRNDNDSQSSGQWVDTSARIQDTFRRVVCIAFAHRTRRRQLAGAITAAYAQLYFVTPPGFVRWI